MKVVIIEDESLAAEKLKRLLVETDDTIEVVAILGSVKESVRWLSVNRADLVFLDIQLSDGISFEIFREIKNETPIIFTTAYNSYAIEAFKLNSIDYLLKPVRKKELEESLRKFREMKKLFLPDMEELLANFTSGKKTYKKRFLIHYGNKLKNVEVKEIAYFYAMDKSVYIKTTGNDTYPCDLTLEKLNEVLDPENFFRINRKLLISIDSIEGMIPYSRSRVKLELVSKPPKDIDPLVSVERASEFKEWLDR